MSCPLAELVGWDRIENLCTDNCWGGVGGGQLGASFFCSQDFKDWSNLQFIFPILTIQLACRYPKFQSTFTQLVWSDPGIAHGSLYNQMNKLIVGPLRESAILTVIIIDAFDKSASEVLPALGQFVSEILEVKYPLTGCPELHIQKGFGLLVLTVATDMFILHEIESNLVNNDIWLSLEQSLLDHAHQHAGLDDWVTREQLDQLYQEAAGPIVYMSGGSRVAQSLMVTNPILPNCSILTHL